MLFPNVTCVYRTLRSYRGIHKFSLIIAFG